MLSKHCVMLFSSSKDRIIDLCVFEKFTRENELCALEGITFKSRTYERNDGMSF